MTEQDKKSNFLADVGSEIESDRDWIWETPPPLFLKQNFQSVFWCFADRAAQCTYFSN